MHRFRKFTMAEVDLLNLKRKFDVSHVKIIWIMRIRVINDLSFKTNISKQKASDFN
jgi:hypothetical protein